MFMGYLCEPFDVEDISSRIGYSLSEEAFGVGPESGFNLFIGSVRINEGALDSEFLHCSTEKVESASVDVH